LTVADKQAAARLLRRLSRHARHATGERLTDDD
jgi:hypothetical protein